MVHVWKQRFLSVFVLLMTVVITLSSATPALASITGNNTFGTAYNMGYWKTSTSDVNILPAGIAEAYFKFTANAGERVYAKSTYNTNYTGMTIEVLNSSGMQVSYGTTVINPDSLPFIYANANATSNSQTFYIRVSRGSYDGDMYFTVSVLDRIKSGSGTFSFTGKAVNSGNSGLNPSGVDSSVISMDLTNNTSIPRNAIVKSVTTSGSQSPSQGNVTHKIMPNQTMVWYTSTVSSSSSGSYTINVANGLHVAKMWSFKYNAKATASSTMSNVKATFNYEYDVTDQF
ncbi:hypothetical protein [Paenibacillus sp. YYML68]|uniref:hypothetical protein n=1 Tax=Paenibacillus sp. YYML68 TaxID=2909250 RepID=UPI002490DD51|nr:hypothetical protein [Paenibacillus sp. YYML68]